MNNWKTAQFELLKRLRDICDANGIAMFLHAETALLSYRSGMLSDRASVCIDISDASKLIAALDADTSGLIAQESMLNNVQFNTVELRIYNPTTTDFNFKDYTKYENNCIHIDVKMIRHIKLVQGYNAKKIMSEYTETPVQKRNLIMTADIFQKLTRSYSNNSHKIKIGSKNFSFSHFASPEKLTIEGEAFYAPSNIEKYFETLYGAGWKTKKIYEFKPVPGVFKASEIPWKDYKESISDVNTDNLMASVAEFDKFDKEYQKYHKNVIKYYKILSDAHENIQKGKKEAEPVAFAQEGGLMRGQVILLDLLKEVAAFLEENDITYYAFGGTTIGALRHKGFIPWDDDIDLVMDIDNYKKLLAVSDQLPWDNIEFNCYENNPDYTRPFAQFTYTTDTRFVKSRMFMKGAALGTGIDIFIMDYVPSAHLDEYVKNALLYQELMTNVYINNEQILEFKDDYFALKEREKTTPKAELIAELAQKLEQYPREECDTMVVRLWARKIRKYKTYEIGEPSYVDFEDMKIPIPAKPEACLRNQYGYDWYILPVSQEQRTHDFYIDFDVSASEYMDYINERIDWNEVENTLSNKKLAGMKRLASKKALDAFAEDFDTRRLLLEYNMDSKRDSLNEILDEGSYERFLEAMAPLTQKAPAIAASSSPQLAALNEFAMHWIKALFLSGKYYSAIKVRKIFDKSCIQPELDNLLDKITALAVAVQDDNKNEISNRLSAISPEYQKSCADCLIARAKLGETEGLKEICINYLKTFPSNCEIKKILGDILSSEGNAEEAKKLYDEVLATSRNGLDILAIKG
ncbi:MAG: LicD family protein [Firmicutes bacterium]|nr:LicD family protein [Bacillota bacterium]